MSLITRVRSRIRAAQATGERGASAVLVAVLLVPALFGALAISMDVGLLMWERRQVQNGADASVLSAAGACALTPTTCTPDISAASSLTTLAGANANDGRNTITSVCGSATARAVSPSLTLCVQPTTPGVVDCPAVPNSASSLSYIELRTRTRTTSNENFITSRVASALTGAARQTPVGACARAAWGPAGPGQDIVLPIIVSECDWKNQTGYTGTPGSAVYPAGPVDGVGTYGYGVGNPWPSFENKVYTKGNPTTCDTSSPGGTAPGGFAALDNVSISGCQASVSLISGYYWAKGNPGNDIPCPSADLHPYLGKVIHIPVFDCMTDAPVTVTSTTNCQSGNGSHNYYRVSGFAAFYLAGWYMSSDPQPSVRPPYAVPCTGTARCISGWFLKDLVPNLPISTTPGPTPPYGLTAITPIG